MPVSSQRSARSPSARAHDFLGSSAPARELAAKVPRLAASNVGLLIEGETGVGKTFVARLIDEASPRAREPLRVINCAAIPETLIESELFGHERGAFTGAVVQRVGALETAGRGTLFLDEIGELSMPSQAKLLRVIEDRRFERIGSNRTIELQARVICAHEPRSRTNDRRRHLSPRSTLSRRRRPRPVPPLRERSHDLPELARQLLADATQSAGRRVTEFSPDAIAAIVAYAWPGNVRELRNAIDHAIALGEGAVVLPGDLPPALSDADRPTGGCGQRPFAARPCRAGTPWDRRRPPAYQGQQDTRRRAAWDQPPDAAQSARRDGRARVVRLSYGSDVGS